MRNVYFLNCHPDNWPACQEHKVFGLKQKNLPAINSRDILLFRTTWPGEYGVKAIWQLKRASPVTSGTHIPWDDGPYTWILECNPLVTFTNPISEEFTGRPGVSQKIEGLKNVRLLGSIGLLKPSEAKQYLTLVINEGSAELKRVKLVEDNKEINLLDWLTEEIHPGIHPPKHPGSLKEGRSSYETEPGNLVGKRIDLPILSYAPLDKNGVILLFGFYLKDLGFSHLEEIRSSFPEAIGVRTMLEGKFQRVRVGFEYKSGDLKLDKQSLQDCDLIVCWENDWKDSPIEVIELSTALLG